MPNPVIIDLSFMAALYVPDEDRSHARNLLLSAGRMEIELHAPDFYLIELSNLLVTNYRRHRITQPEIEHALRDTAQLTVEFHSNPQDLLPRQIGISQRTGLSFYDTVYLDLAARLSARLATLDNRLRLAAAAEGVVLYA